MRHTFPKSEHLTSRKVIDRLFHREKPGTLPAEKPVGDAPLTFYHYPFRVLYFRQGLSNVAETEQAEPGMAIPVESGTLPQVLFSVPKRAFKKAVDRNAVRRRVKEAYRLHKHRLVPRGETKVDNQQIAGPVAQIVFLYTAKTKISFEEIEKGMKLALKRMTNTR
ncbi:ribonuclease P protein component [Fibrella forsythiae]|uniref:Ribonuclease P protein component n=1 Tax=Fibrella forsythiae TaxID=2817061 RepID=A0ABS3JHB1_9BACT|nr:ribonuclease P protein component [Fibrella forsythiae]MBO0948629.1 ribonuclease P protein component [Fibrella forsythiae]